MPDDLKIIHYPDPRLKRISAPSNTLMSTWRRLATRMLELMRKPKASAWQRRRSAETSNYSS